MRKNWMIVLAVLAVGSPLTAAPVSFVTQPTAPPTPAKRFGSVLTRPGASAAQPVAAPATLVSNGGGSRFGRWISGVMPFRQPTPSPALGAPAGQPSPTVRYNPGNSWVKPIKTDPALALDTRVKSPAAVLVAFAKAAEAEGNLDAARQHLQKAVGADPTGSSTLRAAGHFEDRRGKLDVAEALYRRAVQADPAATAALNDLAICLARQGKMDESATAFRQAIAKEPTKTLYRNNLAKVLVEQGDASAALTQLAAVHSMAAAHFNLGYLLQAKGESAAARQHYEVALAADPTLEAARHALAALTAPTNSGGSKVASRPAGPQTPTTAAPPTGVLPGGVPSRPGPAPAGVGPAPMDLPAPPNAAAPSVAPLVTGAPITPARPTTPGFQQVAPGYRPAIASPYYLPPTSVQQR